MRNRLFIALIIWPTVLLQAQESEKDVPFGTEGQYTFETDKPYKLLELDQKTDEPIVTQKKKPRKKVFYGIKTKKALPAKVLRSAPLLSYSMYSKNMNPPRLM